MRLLRPAHLRGEGWTDLYCDVLRHNGQAALSLPDEEQVPVHLEATGDELAAMLAQFVADDALTAEEAAEIVAAVQANAGQRVRIADFVPPSWTPYVKTREQMVADGWLPE